MAVKKTYHSVLDKKTFNIVKSKLSKIEKLTSTHLEDLALQMGMSTGDILIIRNMKEYSGYKNLDELREKISKITFFANKKDCIDIPDKVYETLYCSMNKEQTRIYKDLKSKMFSEYKGREISVINKVAMTIRLQMVAGGIFPYHEEHLAEDVDPTEDLEEYFKKMSSEFNSVAIEGSGKLEALVEDLECVPQDTSIIVWSRFRREIDTIVERLLLEGYSCEKYYGGSSYDTIERFKAKEVQILVANPQKGGEGLNLQVSTLHYFYSNSYRADSRLQAEDRSHRSGQINKVTYKDLVCKGTVDEVILESLKKKEDLINYFRGASSEEFERRLSHDRVESLSRDLEAIM
jgi:SNF2 family DNA or RNA helicase